MSINEEENLRIFEKIPRFTAVGISKNTSKDPVLVDLYDNSKDNKWSIIFSYPGNKFPGAIQNLNVVCNMAHLFEKINCHVYVICNFISWTEMRKFIIEFFGEKTNVTFVLDSNLKIVRKLYMSKTVIEMEDDGGTEGVIEAPSISNSILIYPGYIITTPKREVIQYCILKNKMSHIMELSYFQYPLTSQVIFKLLENIKGLSIIYSIVERLAQKHENIKLKSYVETMALKITHGESVLPDKSKRISLNDWAKNFTRGLYI